MDEAHPKPRGRPRSERARTAILAAAYDLVTAHGYAAVTTAEIAAAAGSGKQTIYRWWPAKSALVLDALAMRDDGALNAQPSGSLPACLAELCARVTVDAPLLRALMAEAQHEPELRTALKSRWVEPRRAYLTRCLLATGHVPGRILETLVTMIEGALIEKILLDEPLDEAFADELVIVAEVLAGN